MRGIDRRSADAFFSRKVPGSVKYEGSRHTAYRVETNGKVLLGNLTISRGSSGMELDARNLKGLASDMGMSVEGFLEASECRIRPRLVVYCIVARVLEQAKEQYVLDSVQYDKNIVALLFKAIDEWLAFVPKTGGSKLSIKEIKELERCRTKLTSLLQYEVFAEYVQECIERLAAIQN